MRRTFIFFIWVFIIIQFFRVDYTNPESNPEDDLLVVANPPEEVANILTKSCYDCHSNKTVWPWYSQIAPFSWWTEHHVTEARRHFNFSEWDEMDERHIAKFVEEAEYEILEGEMPLPPYTIMHANTKLTEDEKDILINWLNSL
ncbi:MAG: heme-binding domain-containing protein [Salibacteraceae bacterium]